MKNGIQQKIQRLFFITTFFLFSQISVASAAEYVDATVTVIVNNEVLIESTEYISSDGCTVSDSSAKNHTITGAKAVCALYSAAQVSSVPLDLEEFPGFGLFVEKIGAYANDSYLDHYWGYYVNGVSPSVGVAAKEIESGDAITFVYGYGMQSPLILEIDDTHVVTDKKITVTVKKNDGEKYIPAPNATVFVNDWEYTTDENGQAFFAVPKKGKKEVYATLEGYARTTAIDVVIYKKHAKKKKLSLAAQEEMVQEGFDFLEKKSVYATIKKSPSFRDWMIMARVANGNTPTQLLKKSAAYNPKTVGTRTEYARTILALTAGEKKKDARQHASSLTKTEDVCADAYINDEIYTVLALRSLAEEKTEYKKAIKKNLSCALKSQTKSGGVSLTQNARPDIDTTAVFVQMLASVEKDSKRLQIKKERIVSARKEAAAYLKEQQNPDGGWGYAEQQSSNSSSTATVLMAFSSISKHPMEIEKNKRNGFDFLRTVQKKSGAFAYDAEGSYSVEELNTIFATLALTRSYIAENKNTEVCCQPPR